MNSDRIESTILTNLFYLEDYTRKVLPFIKSYYFSKRDEQLLFGEIDKFVQTYKNLPTKEAILIELGNKKDINEEEYKNVKDLINSISKEEDTDLQWLLDTTEKFCKDRAVHNAVLDGIKILDNKDKVRTPEAIPGILADALAVSFDNHIGHDYLADAQSRFDWYHTKEKRYKFDLSYFNRITKGGVPSKTLNIALAGTGVGKSLFMCHVASSFLTQGLNVLYITLEMAEERIAERIDANLFDVTIDDLHAMPKELYDTKLNKLESKTKGKLIIKEYPTASAHSGHFRSLLNELALKKSFRPQVIFIDYLNICASSRFKGGNISSYFYIKAIAEELRGLAVEFDVPIFSATQTTRTGFVSTDIGLEDTSESFGLPATADFMFALMSNEELESLGQMKVKQLKNRYNDPGMNRAFILGVDKSKMRLYDVENSAQNIVDSNQTKEKENYPTPEQSYDKFSDFKI
ncbi:DNA primase [bacterium]|nr:DNA primase [bacterium]